MTGYHTRWVRPETGAEHPERLAIRESLAFGKALYDRRTALGHRKALLDRNLCEIGVGSALYGMDQYFLVQDLACRQ